MKKNHFLTHTYEGHSKPVKRLTSRLSLPGAHNLTSALVSTHVGVTTRADFSELSSLISSRADAATTAVVHSTSAAAQLWATAQVASSASNSTQRSWPPRRTWLASLMLVVESTPPHTFWPQSDVGNIPPVSFFSTDGNSTSYGDENSTSEGGVDTYTFYHLHAF